MPDLKDRIVLVTGAAGAVGRGVVAAVRRAGGVAVASDLGNGAGVDIELDVTAEADWQRAAAELERRHGRLDGLVNAAGIVALGSVEQLDFATWRRVLTVNLDGAFRCCARTAARSPICRWCRDWSAGTISPPTMRRRAAFRC